jgi:hypothetical protein
MEIQFNFQPSSPSQEIPSLNFKLFHLRIIGHLVQLQASCPNSIQIGSAKKKFY